MNRFTNAWWTHSFIPDTNVSVVTGRQQILVLPVPLHLRRSSWKPEGRNFRLRSDIYVTVYYFTDQFVCTYQQQKEPRWVYECLCVETTKRRERLETKQLKHFSLFYFFISLLIKCKTWGIVSPCVPDVDVSVHWAGDQELRFKPGPVQITEDDNNRHS